MNKKGFLLLSLVMQVAYCSRQVQDCIDSKVHNIDVYGVYFDNCSMSINWKSPVIQECNASVLHVTVRFGKGCSPNLKNITLESNKTSLVLNDEEIVMACATGEYYFQVIAEVQINYLSPVQELISSCIMISESYYETFQLYAYNSSEIGQEVCIPIRLCSNRVLPTFILNDTAIPVDSDRSNVYYISGGKFCFSRLESNAVLYETCVAQSICSVCSNYTGNITIISRSQLMISTENAGSDPPTIAKKADEFCNIPTVIFCGSSYILSNNSTTVIVCIFVPFNESQTTTEISLLYELRNQNNSLIMTTNVGSNVSNSVVSRIRLDSAQEHCTEIESLGCVQNNTYISVCIKGNSTRDMVYVPEPCKLIQIIRNGTDECTTVTVPDASLSLFNIIAITISVTFLSFFTILLSVTIIFCKRKGYIFRKYYYNLVKADDN